MSPRTVRIGNTIDTPLCDDNYPMSNQDLTILVVDDVEENVILIRRFLEVEQYQVCSAPDGRRALEILKKEKIDLAILDINMPFIDGISLLKAMRDDQQQEQIPVLMLTAMDDIKTTMECMRLGACGYITKPFNLKNLKQQIETCLSRSSNSDTTDALPESL